MGFTVGEGTYAVDVPAVREILSPIALVSVPHASSIVLGVADHRGRVVPIVDLRRRFGIPPLGSRRSKWIVVEIDDRWFGLAVDDVSEVFSVVPENQRTNPRIGPGDVAGGFSAVFAHEGKLVLVLDLRVLARAVEDDPGPVHPPALASGSDAGAPEGGG